MITVENQITINIRGTVYIVTVEEAIQLTSDIINSIPFPKQEFNREEDFAKEAKQEIHEEITGREFTDYEKAKIEEAVKKYKEKKEAFRKQSPGITPGQPVCPIYPIYPVYPIYPYTPIGDPFRDPFG